MKKSIINKYEFMNFGENNPKLLSGADWEGQTRKC